MGSRKKISKKQPLDHNQQLVWTGFVGLTILFLLLSRMQNSPLPEVLTAGVNPTPEALMSGQPDRTLANQPNRIK